MFSIPHPLSRPRLRRYVLAGLVVSMIGACADGGSPTEPQINETAPGSTAILGDATDLRGDSRRADAITSVIQDLAQAWNAGDPVAYAALFAEDAIFIGPTGFRGEGRASVQQVHTFLFAGPFRGSTSTPTIVDLTLLRGGYAVVDADVTLTGFQFLPPGLVATAPGIQRSRIRSLLEFRHGKWEIIRQQVSAIAPAPPAP